MAYVSIIRGLYINCIQYVRVEVSSAPALSYAHLQIGQPSCPSWKPFAQNMKHITSEHLVGGAVKRDNRLGQIGQRERERANGGGGDGRG